MAKSGRIIIGSSLWFSQEAAKAAAGVALAEPQLFRGATGGRKPPFVVGDAKEPPRADTQRDDSNSEDEQFAAHATDEPDGRTTDFWPRRNCFRLAAAGNAQGALRQQVAEFFEEDGHLFPGIGLGFVFEGDEPLVARFAKDIDEALEVGGFVGAVAAADF